MKTRVFFAFGLLILFSGGPLFAHTPLLLIDGNDDTVVYVQAGFSTGQGAEGLPLYVKSLVDDREIEKLSFPASSQLEVKIPQEPYYLLFDGGPGHKAAKPGPAPAGGFTVHPEAVKNDIPNQGLPTELLFIALPVVLLGLLLVKIVSRKKRT